MAALAKFLFVIFLTAYSFRIEGEECERDKSRTVRDVLYQEMLLLYKSVGAKIPYKCPFYKDRDRYRAHEEHKERESSQRWACNYCGKVFIGELYLDMHMANRHQDRVYKEKDSVCLADYCELFRCDVLSGVAKPTFWDLALCMEEDMKDLAQDCEDLMTECVPESLNWNTSRTLKSSLVNVVCSYLTCKKYYDAPVLEEKDTPETSSVLLTVLLCAVIIIYYCVAINYFWMDTFSDIYDNEEYIGRGPESLFNPDKFPKIAPLNKPRKKNIVHTDSEKGSDIFNMKKIEGLQGSVKKARNAAREQLENRPKKRVETLKSNVSGEGLMQSDTLAQFDNVTNVYETSTANVSGEGLMQSDNVDQFNNVYETAKANVSGEGLMQSDNVDQFDNVYESHVWTETAAPDRTEAVLEDGPFLTEER